MLSAKDIRSQGRPDLGENPPPLMNAANDFSQGLTFRVVFTSQCLPSVFPRAASFVRVLFQG